MTKMLDNIRLNNVWETITRWCLYLALLLTPIFFLPFTLQPVGLNKQIILVVLVLIATISWLIKGIASGRLVVWNSNVNWLLLLLAISVVISAWLSGAAHLSFRGVTGGEVDTVVNFVSLILLFFLLTSNIKNEKEANRASLLFLISSVLVLIFGVLQMLSVWLLPWQFTKDVSFNPVGTTNALGLFLGFVFVLLISLFYHNAKDWSRMTRLVMGIIALAIFVVLFLISYWPVFAGLILSMIVILLSGLRTKSFEARTLVVPFIILAISVFVLLVGLGVLNFRLPVFNLPAEITPSLGASWNITKSTLQDGVTKFIFGSGPATYQYQYGLYRDASLNTTPFWSLRFSQGFNALFTHLVNWGLLGTLLFTLFLLSILISALRFAFGNKQTPSLFWALTIGFVYLLLSLLFYPQNLVIYFALFASAGLLMALKALYSGNHREFSLSSSPQKTFIFSLVMMVLILLVAAALYVNGQRYVAALYFSKGVAISNDTGDIERAMPYLLSGLNLDSRNDLYLQTLATAFLVRVSNILNQTDIAPADLQVQFSSNVGAAVQAAQRSTQVNPRNSANWLGLARVYENIILLVPGAADLAFAAYSEAINLEPNNPVIPSNAGRAHLANADRISQELSAISGDFTKISELKVKRDEGYKAALDNFDRAINLKPDYAPAHFSLVQVFDRQGKTDEAVARAERLRSLAPNDVGVLFQLGLLHYQANRLNNAKEAFEAAVSISPNYSNALYFLGLIYDRQGQVSNALSAFQKIGQLNPENNEVKQIISNIRSGLPALSGIGTVAPQERKEAPIEERPKEVIEVKAEEEKEAE